MEGGRAREGEEHVVVARGSSAARRAHQFEPFPEIHCALLGTFFCIHVCNHEVPAPCSLPSGLVPSFLPPFPLSSLSLPPSLRAFDDLRSAAPHEPPHREPLFTRLSEH